MIFLLLAGLSAPASAEAERLGRELAATGALETILPVMAAKETEEVVAEHSELSAPDREILRDTGKEVAAAERERLTAAFGHRYAAALAIGDLRALVAFGRTAAARRYREVVPNVTIQSLASLGKLDFKADLARAFCVRTGKLCGPR